MECRSGLAMRILSVCLSICLSLCLSVCQTRALWQNGRSICPDFYTIRKIILTSFLRRRMVGGRRPLIPEILGQPAPSILNTWIEFNSMTFLRMKKLRQLVKDGSFVGYSSPNFGNMYGYFTFIFFLFAAASFFRKIFATRVVSRENLGLAWNA